MTNINKWMREEKNKEAIVKLLALAVFSSVMFAALSLTTATSILTVDLLMPADAYQSNSSTVQLDYYVSFNASLCQLEINSAAVQSLQSIVAGFNAFTQALSPGNHSWRITCIYHNSSSNSSNNITFQSSQRTIVIDQTPPSIILLSPQDNEQFTSRNATISYVAIDNHASNMNCSTIINNQTINTTLAANSQPVLLTVTALQDATHTWMVTCSDKAYNTRASQTRSFTINSTSQTPPPPTFSLTLTKSEIVAGDAVVAVLSAPNGSSARLEACPDRLGFVECSTALNQQNITSYPVHVNLPFANKEGKYVVEAYFTRSSESAIRTERYNVTSNLAINTQPPYKPRVREPVILEASATGGLGNIYFTWILSNGTRVNAKKANITYTQPGTYTNIIIASDEHANSRNTSITFEVSEAYTINFAVKDEDSKTPIIYATIEIDSQVKDTNANGEATMHIRPGHREYLVMALNYSISSQEINVTSEQSLTILMKRLDFKPEPPSITLTYPAEGQSIIGSTTEVGFAVSHKQPANCSIYISESQAGFYTYLGSAPIQANDKAERRFEIIDLENKTYYWNVECTDAKNTTATSQARSFSVGYKPTQTQQSVYADLRLLELENSLSRIESLPLDLKEAVDATGLKKQVEDAIRELKNSVRDLEGLKYKKLDQQKMKAEEEAIASRAQSTYNKAPVKFDLLSSDSFVDYISSQDLEALATELITLMQSDAKNINVKLMMQRLNALQQEALITSKTKVIRIIYADGEDKVITAVIRDLKAYNLSQGTQLVEKIPSQVATGASSLKSMQEFKVLKDDLIIAFPITRESRIAYYIEGQVNAQEIKLIKTALFSESTTSQSDKITGFGIASIKSVLDGAKNISYVLIIAAILTTLLVFGAVRLEGHKAVKYAVYLAKRKDTLHYVNVVLSDIEENLQAGNLVRAIGLYDEIKTAYNELPSVAKNDVFESIEESAQKIQAYQNNASGKSAAAIISLVSSANDILTGGNIMQAIQEYKQIESAYHQLEEDAKEAIHPQVAELGNKLQIMIASNKD